MHVCSRMNTGCRGPTASAAPNGTPALVKGRLLELLVGLF